MTELNKNSKPFLAGYQAFKEKGIASKNDCPYGGKNGYHWHREWFLGWHKARVEMEATEGEGR